MKKQLSEQLSATQPEQKPLYNAVVLYGHIYELVTDFNEQQPCSACEIQPICEALSYEPGICAIFDGIWNQYFRRRK